MEHVGCYHDMIRYLSEINNVSPYKLIVTDSVEDLYNTIRGRKVLKYPSYKITCILHGESYWFLAYTSNRLIKKGDYPLNTKGEYIKEMTFDRYEIRLFKSIKDFPDVSIEKCGKYKDSLGGGWYSNIDLVKINSRYFAPEMECTCCV